MEYVLSDLIEKAAKKLQGQEDSSLVERAAEKLAAAGSALPQNEAIGPANSFVLPQPGLAGPGATAGAVSGISPKVCTKYAEIDWERLRRQGIIVPGDKRSKIAEEFRIIKRQLLREAFNGAFGVSDRKNLIMVTSAGPGEGKTFTALCLAMSISMERDRHVLLVDADITNPSILDVLGIEADRGLTDYLDDDSVDLADLIIRTDASNVSVLPAGRRHRLATELMASSRMSQFANDIATRYPDRITILDTGPVLATSEASTLAEHIGQIVMVVEAERTSDGAVKSALELLSTCENVRLVLNKTLGQSHSDYFGSYYYSYDKAKSI